MARAIFEGMRPWPEAEDIIEVDSDSSEDFYDLHNVYNLLEVELVVQAPQQLMAIVFALNREMESVRQSVAGSAGAARERQDYLRLLFHDVRELRIEGDEPEYPEDRDLFEGMVYVPGTDESTLPLFEISAARFHATFRATRVSLVESSGPGAPAFCRDA